MKEIRRLAVCGLCGEKLVRLPNVHGRERWNCPVCKEIDRSVTDALLAENTVDALNRIIRDPSVLRVKQVDPAPNYKAERMAQELRERLSEPDSDEAVLKQLAFELAAARYDQISGAGYETERLRRIFQRAEPGTSVDTGLLRDAISAIQVQPDGRINLRLKNNQTI